MKKSLMHYVRDVTTLQKQLTAMVNTNSFIPLPILDKKKKTNRYCIIRTLFFYFDAKFVLKDKL